MRLGDRAGAVVRREYQGEVEKQVRQVYEYAAPALLEENRSLKRWGRYTMISPKVRRAAVEKLGWERPTDIQRKVFQLVMRERSVRTALLVISDVA